MCDIGDMGSFTYEITIKKFPAFFLILTFLMQKVYQNHFGFPIIYHFNQ